ncbi:MAG: hypothetical protein EOP19_32520 [Hyphomicrobiales bacterium]|nr:MAG: hypothetical protein EOP19_32520 [Hyphomicrobiales bacterium]
MRLYEVTVTTAADGSATAYAPSAGKCRGLLEAIQYEKVDFADGVDFTITDEVTGESLWTDTNVNASEIVRPRAAVADQAGAARLYAAGGTAVAEKIAIVSRIKLVIAQGGNVKSGKFRLHIG